MRSSGSRRFSLSLNNAVWANDKVLEHLSTRNVFRWTAEIRSAQPNAMRRRYEFGQLSGAVPNLVGFRPMVAKAARYVTGVRVTLILLFSREISSTTFSALAGVRSLFNSCSFIRGG